MDDIQKTKKHCLDKLDLKNAKLSNEYYYSSLPLCVIDSVFSIGVKYQGVKNTINRICEYYSIEQFYDKKLEIPVRKNQKATSYFITLFENADLDSLVLKVFRNRQRTSVKNGILKVKAVIKFLKVLKEFKIEYFQDIQKVIGNHEFEKAIKDIPGQRSGISLKYFYMLTGSENDIKPDRMIMRFLYDATDNNFNIEQCQNIIISVVKELNKDGYELTPKLLDNIIWNYQRNKKS